MRPKVERIAIYIWLIASALNCLSIGIYVDGFRLSLLPMFLTMGSFISLLFSLPALVFINMTISYCHTWKKSATFMFRTCLIMSVALALLTWLLIALMFEGMFKEWQYALFPVGSALLATATQYRNFKRLATYNEIFFETI